MRLSDLSSASTAEQAAVGALLRQVKPERDPSALIQESLSPGQYSQIALDEDDQVRGWLWGRPLFEGIWAWELRWLVVDQAHREHGVGRALVGAFEDWCRARSVLTIWLMTGEEMGETSLRGADLWADPFAPLDAIAPVDNSPFVFWQRMGYRFIGVIPDANGRGVPEYLMGKSLKRTPDEP